jgi:biotin carboxyl carrier protein
VVAKMDDSELKQQLAQEEAKLKQSKQGGDPKNGEAQIAEAKKQIEDLQSKIKHAEIRAHMAGTLVKGPEDLLKKGQAVRAEQPLCGLAQTVKYMIDAMPDQEFGGSVETISVESKIRDQGNVFIATMDVENKMDPENKRRIFNPGMRGTASIDVGREVVGYILFRKIWNFIRLRVLF